MLVVGAGLTIVPLTAVLLRQAPAAHVGAASSLNQNAQQFGVVVGLAVLTMVFGTVRATLDEGEAIRTALSFAIVFPLAALLLFAVWGRRVSSLSP